MIRITQNQSVFEPIVIELTTRDDAKTFFGFIDKIDPNGVAFNEKETILINYLSNRRGSLEI